MSSSSIQHATYPLPQPLTLLLEASIGPHQKQHDCSKEPKSAALSQLIGNALEAMDRLYFSTVANERSADWFLHRTCLRINVSPTSISITDLGAGMTRADLINSLGIGRLSKKAMRVAAAMTKLIVKNNNNKKHQQQGDDDNNELRDEEPIIEEDTTTVEDNGEKEETDQDTDDTDDDGDDDDDDDDDDEEEADDKEVLPCLEADIGGFYSALCALGVGVTIGTKVC
jgi:hypothetical protein